MMDQDLNRLLFELLGTLSEATKKITDILCRKTGISETPTNRSQAGELEAITEKIQQTTSALDRVQQETTDESEDHPAVDEPASPTEDFASAVEES